MISVRRLNTLAVMLATLALVACGGGSTTLAGGGTGGTGISSGTISAFGSVYVNGVRYRTSPTTQVFVDEMTALEDDLDVGMVVRVEYEESNGEFDARRIDYAKELEGPVTANAIDPVTAIGTLTVLGQIVSVDETTVYRNSDFVGARPTIADLQPGDVVEISGFPSGSGALAATRIELKSIGGTGTIVSEVAGLIDRLEPSGFRIGSLLITYDDATEFKDGLSAGNLNVGLYVKVKGETADGVTLAALSIEAIDDLLSGEEGDEFEVSGFVTSRTATTVVVSGTNVALTDQTRCRPDSDCGTIEVGDRVEVDGRFGTGGERIAEEVEVKSVIATTEYEGGVVAIEVADVNVDPNVGTLTVLVDGVATEFAVTAQTIMVDDGGASLNLSQIEVDDMVEVYAYSDGTSLIATKVEREESSGSGGEVASDSAIDERTEPGEQLILSGTAPVALTYAEVDKDSIVITDLSGTTTYVDDIDYAVSEESLGADGTQTLIARVAGGGIADGETVVASYSYEID